MNKKGFTLVELLGVIVILSIIMLIAIPNVTAVLERSKKDSYIVDCKKFVSLVQYELRSGKIAKPAPNENTKVELDYFKDNDEIVNDSDGNQYDPYESYVIVSNEDGFLVYYVQLVAKNNGMDDSYRGIEKVNSEELDGDKRYQYYRNSIELSSR